MTPVEQIINNATSNFRTTVRNVYIGTIGYINSLVPEFLPNQTTIDTFDSRIGDTTDRYVSTWPAHLNRTHNDNDRDYLSNVAIYNNVLVSMHIDVSGVYIKFPTVSLEGHALNSYTARRWKRTGPNATGRRYYGGYDRHTDPKVWETKAFVADRVPTIEELFRDEGPGYYNNYVQTKQINILNRFQLKIGPNDSVLDQIMEGYKNYLSSVKRGKSYNDTSKTATYKAYLKHRGNPMLVQYRTDNPKPATTAAKTP